MTGNGSNQLSNTGMLWLFRDEVASHSEKLNNVLTELANQPTLQEHVDAMASAVRAVLGAARIIKLDLAEELAAAMSEFVKSFAPQLPTAPQLKPLQSANAVLQQIGRLAKEETAEQLFALEAEVHSAVTGLCQPAAPAGTDQPSATPKAATGEETISISEPAMLELFLAELETHTQTLSDGLLKLEQEPDSRTDIASLMRAAHSIKGAARIVKLDLAVDLAHAMEDVFVAHEEAGSCLDAEDIDRLLKGTDALLEIGNRITDAAPSGNEQFAAETQVLVDVLRGRKDTGQTGPPPPQEKTSHAGLSADPVMLEMFRAEAENHTAEIDGELQALLRDPGRTKGFPGLIRAAHSVKGAARMVGLDSIVGLASALEEAFEAVQKNGVKLGAEHIDCLRQVGEALRRAGRLAAPDTMSQLSKLDIYFEALESCLQAIRDRRALPVIPERPRLQRPAVPSGLPAVAEGPGAARQPIRVSAGQMEHLLAVAGESLVQSRWLEGHAAKLLGLRREQIALGALATELNQHLADNSLSRAKGTADRITSMLARSQGDLAEASSALESTTLQLGSLAESLHQSVIDCRMRPFVEGTRAFPRMVRDLAKKLEKKAHLTILGTDTKVDRDVLEELHAPVTHLLRNALDHGIETPKERAQAGKPEMSQLTLEATHQHGRLCINMSDDGRGIDVESLRMKIVDRGFHDTETVARLTEAEVLNFLFLPGFTTTSKITEISGRGVGMDVVHQMVQEVGGRVSISTELGQGTTVRLQLPISRSLLRALLCRINDELYAFRLTDIDHCRRIPVDELSASRGKGFIATDESKMQIARVQDLLDMQQAADPQNVVPVVVLRHRAGFAGIIVDQFLGERELVVRPLDPRLGAVRGINAAAVEETGQTVLILDAEELLFDMHELFEPDVDRHQDDTEAKRVLVVDDSVTVREAERHLLEDHGYVVDVAIDGLDGWNALSMASYDAIVSDIDMPRMDGLTLVREIRKDERFAHIPIVIVSYKDRQQDLQAGLERGADAYLSKASLHDDSLIRIIQNLLSGAPQ